MVAYRVGDIEENALTDRILISLRSPAPIRHLNHQKVHKLFSLTYWCFQVRQLLAVDGRVHLNFGITATGSSQNYTRSYYLNGRDYIVSGSCDEHVVRICCAQTGRRLRDISLEVQYSSDLHIICPPLMFWCVTCGSILCWGFKFGVSGIKTQNFSLCKGLLLSWQTLLYGGSFLYHLKDKYFSILIMNELMLAPPQCFI